MSEVKEKEPKEDSFVLVRSRRGKHSQKKHKNNINIRDIYNSDNFTHISPETVYKKVLSAKEDISESTYYTELSEELNRLLDVTGHKTIKEILCYSLGHFSYSVPARYQFGLLLALKDHLSAPVFVHDPVFSETEINVIKQLQCNVIEENEEGKRKISDTTLVYLPHCPKQLINNFLWCNWGKDLNSCVFISNSFSKIVELNSDSTLKKNIKYILDILPSVVEIELKNTFRFSDIFNDLSFHVFPKAKLDGIAESIWKSNQEPVYQTEEIEFIAHQLSKSLSVSNGSE